MSKENVDFTSPYIAKVRKEVESQRMEEVDLDTALAAGGAGSR